jgi:hypothetical protein
MKPGANSEEDVMKRALVIAFCVMMVLGSIAFAGTAPVRVNIPFAFHAGDADFPAGEYVMQYLYSSNIMVRSVDGQDGAFVSINRATALKNVPAYSVSFNRYGEQYFLAALDNGDFKASVLKTGAEKKLAGKHFKGTVIASLMK